MQDFSFIKGKLSDVVLINPKFIEDIRGSFIKLYERRLFEKHNIQNCFWEENEINSLKGVLRGIHYQMKYPQGKLIRVINGSIYQVAVDLRKSSRTCGKWEAYLLSGQNRNMLYIPPGFGAANLVLEDNTIINVKCTSEYLEEYSRGISWNDHFLDITWPVEQVDRVIISQKDLNWPQFKQVKEFCM